MWDGRDIEPGQAIRDDLIDPGADAVTGHAQGAPPSAAQVRAIVDFELGLFTTQIARFVSGQSQRARRTQRSRHARARAVLHRHQRSARDAAVDARRLRRPPVGLDPCVFTLFEDGPAIAQPERAGDRARRGDLQHAPVRHRQRARAERRPVGSGRRPIQNGTCTICHDTPNAGNHSVPMALNIGIADASRRTPDLPLYTLRHRATGETVQTTDPGRAMVTGKWNDIGKFKGPVLRALAARAPYFHDGSAATLADVIEFYDTRFQTRFTEREKADLLAFLHSL